MQHLYCRWKGLLVLRGKSIRAQGISKTRMQPMSPASIIVAFQ